MAQGGMPQAGFSGVADELATVLDRGRIGGAVVVAAAPVELWRRAHSRTDADVEDQVLARLVELNEWTCGVVGSDSRLRVAIAAEASIDPLRMTTEIHDKAARRGVCGVKLHPALNFTLPSHPGYREILRAVRDTGLVVVAHGGGSAGTPYEAPVDYCAPANFEPLLVEFPTVPLVVAHLAYPYIDDLTRMAGDHPNLFTDLSYVVGAGHLSGRRLRSAVRAFGVERVLFGSDFPYFDPEKSRDSLDAAGLTASEFEAVCSGNAKTLFGFA
jgi:hypothetical protein